LILLFHKVKDLMYPIDPKDMLARLKNGEILNLLDEREEIEYHTYNIGDQNIPLSKFDQSLDLLNYNKTDKMIVICRMGIRSQTARSILAQNGYNNARNLTGSLTGLQNFNKYPTYY